MVSNRLHNQVRDWHTAEVGCTAEDWGTAARKLIGNHEYVLRDAVHPEPRTQIDLARSSASDATAVDAALLAVAECLLEGAALFGNADSGSWPTTTLPAPATPEAAAVWVAISKYLERRMQTTAIQDPGRIPDLPEPAAHAMRAALRAVGAIGARHASAAGALPAGVGRRSTASSTSCSTIRLAPGGEVLLAAGALGSPQVLQLSGIGPPSVLAAAGVPLRHALPAVGAGLQDHPAVTVGFNSAIRDGLSEIKPLGWLGLDIISPLALYKWAVRGGGVLCTTFCDHGAFVRSDGVGKSADGRGGRAKDAALPDLQLRFVPGIGPSPDGVKAYELLGKGVQHGHSGFTLQVIACRPRSTGTVRITCADPSVAPEIKCNYLASPEDSQTLARGIELARKLATSGALGEVSLDEVYPGAHVQSDAAVDAYIRETLHSANGLSGGCCLGHVVDEQLRVRGIRGLRVVDASVMPRIPGAQLALPTNMIAERAARFIGAAHSLGGTAAGKGHPPAATSSQLSRRAPRSPERRRSVAVA
jgi:choline dehydrogenase-like flavoprotein